MRFQWHAQGWRGSRCWPECRERSLATSWSTTSVLTLALMSIILQVSSDVATPFAAVLAFSPPGSRSFPLKETSNVKIASSSGFFPLHANLFKTTGRLGSVDLIGSLSSNRYHDKVVDTITMMPQGKPMVPYKVRVLLAIPLKRIFVGFLLIREDQCLQGTFGCRSPCD
jgi:hypothetical protein